MPNQINDGVVAYGSRIITTSRGGVYVTDNFDYKPGKKSIVRTNQVDVKTGQVITRGVQEGTATFQYSAASTSPPQFGDTFPGIAVDAVAGVTTWIISEVGEAEKKDAETKINVGFTEQLGATAPVTS